MVSHAVWKTWPEGLSRQKLRPKATTHYLSQWLPRSPTPHSVTRPQWVKANLVLPMCWFVLITQNTKKKNLHSWRSYLWTGNAFRMHMVFVRGIHRLPVVLLTKGQRHGTEIHVEISIMSCFEPDLFSLILNCIIPKPWQELERSHFVSFI